jgi:hypothetical protein
MRHRRIPIDEPDLCVGIFRPELVGDEHLDALHGLFRIPMIAVEMRGRPNHAPKSVHAGEAGDKQILRDILKRDVPRITRALEQGFDFVFHPPFLAKIGSLGQNRLKNRFNFCVSNGDRPQVLDLTGAPGEIRTPDPQIRSLHLGGGTAAVPVWIHRGPRFRGVEPAAPSGATDNKQRVEFCAGLRSAPT